MKGLYFLLFLNANCYTIWLDYSELDDNELFDHNDSDLKTMKRQPNNYRILPSPSPTPVEEMTFYSDEGNVLAREDTGNEITKLDKKTYKDIAAMNSYVPYLYDYGKDDSEEEFLSRNYVDVTAFTKMIWNRYFAGEVLFAS